MDQVEVLNKMLTDLKNEKKAIAINIEIKRINDAIKNEKTKIEKMKDVLNAHKFTDEENKDAIKLMNGMPIRHKYCKNNSTWTAICDGRYIIHNDVIYTSPSGFAKAHLKEVAFNERKTFDINGWTACEVYYSGEWIKLHIFRNKRMMIV